jgi:hypothetical protein
LRQNNGGASQDAAGDEHVQSRAQISDQTRRSVLALADPAQALPLLGGFGARNPASVASFSHM